MSVSSVICSTEKELIIYRRKIVFFGLLICSFLVGVVSFSSGFLYPGDGSFHINNLLWWPLVVLFISFSICVWCVYLITKNKPLLILNQEGIFTSKTGYLSWKDIESTNMRQPYINIPYFLWKWRSYVRSLEVLDIVLKNGKHYILSSFDLEIDEIHNLVKIMEAYRSKVGYPSELLP